MKIEIDIDEKYTDLGVKVTAPDLTPDIERIISLMRMMDMQIPVKRNDETILLDVDEILLRPHEWQHTRPPCPLPTPGVHSTSCPSSR